MRKVMQAAALALVITLTTGCGAWTYTRSMFVSGISLEGLGEQFVSVSTQVTEGCKLQVIQLTTCAKYRVFGEHFKKAYPLTVSVWKAARKAGDTAMQDKAEDVIRVLSKDLTKLAVEALGALAPEGR